MKRDFLKIESSERAEKVRDGGMGRDGCDTGQSGRPAVNGGAGDDDDNFGTINKIYGRAIIRQMIDRRQLDNYKIICSALFDRSVSATQRSFSVACMRLDSPHSRARDGKAN